LSGFCQLVSVSCLRGRGKTHENVQYRGRAALQRRVTRKSARASAPVVEFCLYSEFFRSLLVRHWPERSENCRLEEVDLFHVDHDAYDWDGSGRNEVFVLEQYV
jgi:hypothetical protein